jgi:hypothetical protein
LLGVAAPCLPSPVEVGKDVALATVVVDAGGDVGVEVGASTLCGEGLSGGGWAPSIGERLPTLGNRLASRLGILGFVI